MRFILLLILTANLLASCTHRPAMASNPAADTLELRYAQYLTLIEYPDYTEVEIRNPWDDSKLLQRFRIIDRGCEHLAIFTTTHANLIEELGGIDAIAGVCEDTFSIRPWITGIIIMILVALVILGGVKRIASVNEKIVPAMAIFFMVCTLIVLVINYDKIPNAFSLIFTEA